MDDGGSPLTSYLIEKKDFDKDVWISCGKILDLRASLGMNLGESPGLVVMGGDSCSRRCEILDGHFSHLFVVKILMCV